MDTLWPYLAAVVVVFAVSLMPAFGPPTALVVVLLGLNWELDPVALVVGGAFASGAGRMVLAAATGRVGDRLGEPRRENLRAARDYVTGNRGRALAGLGVFLVSPLPSAQMFEAAGLMGVRLLPVTAAHIAAKTSSLSSLRSPAPWTGPDSRSWPPGSVSASPRTGATTPMR